MKIINIEQMDDVVVKAANSSESFHTLEYQKKLYRRISSFDITHRDFALKSAKDAYLKNKALVDILLVDEVQCWGIWQEDDTLIRVTVEDQPSIIEKIDLKKLVAKMRDIGGIEIGDRRYKLQVYPRCFVGQEAVDWFIEKLDIERSEAVELGQRLIEEKIIHHVADGHQFEDEYLFYRFYWDEQK
ncbi:pleckstrin/ G-protein interacting- domain protein [[Leptolyngbya] sp. PCC 7376]|uniref:DEP domain-containing protein n=1 Tax=[Leptolyngbya] sp. PCC 7376 TaxID=111781 RepID=UPI00029F20FE|nr:DEP domain-containing protein [[Leptolyngbya] sp. PCC 7376]AFY37904.1 pleckstrin/ G-protein interacting- domain protein [[Leptolyngbya] sp. PCC 7376]